MDREPSCRATVLTSAASRHHPLISSTVEKTRRSFRATAASAKNAHTAAGTQMRLERAARYAVGFATMRSRQVMLAMIVTKTGYGVFSA